MRTTVEFPDELWNGPKRDATQKGLSPGQLILEAVEQKLPPGKRKIRRIPLAIGDIDTSPIAPPTREQIDEAMFS